MPSSIEVFLADEAATLGFARRLAPLLATGGSIWLEGDLGAGKTTFCRGLIQGLGHNGPVKSPTFTLVEPYRIGELEIFHFDLYRLNDPQELEYLAVDECFDSHHLSLVEWPRRGGDRLPPCDLMLVLEPRGTGRMLFVNSCSPRGEHMVRQLGTHC